MCEYLFLSQIGQSEKLLPVVNLKSLQTFLSNDLDGPYLRATSALIMKLFPNLAKGAHANKSSPFPLDPDLVPYAQTASLMQIINGVVSVNYNLELIVIQKILRRSL